MSATMTTQELFQPGLTARAAARIRHRLLDQELADGADPADCPQWAARAVELTKRCSRERAADEIEQLLRFPEEPHRLRVGPHQVATQVNRDGCSGSRCCCAATRPCTCAGWRGCSSR